MSLRSTGRGFIPAVIIFFMVVVGSPAAPQGPWVQPAVDLSATGQSADHPQISSAADGTVTAVWDRYNGVINVVQASTRLPGGSFGAPVNLSASGQNAYQPQVTSAPDGTTTVVWRRYDGSEFIIQAATRPPGGSFGSQVTLSVAGQNAEDPQITTAPDGTATAVWYRSNGTNNIVQAATRPPGGTFGAPVDLSAAGLSAIDPQIANAPDGTATAIWRRFSGSDLIVQASIRPPAGVFGTPFNLSAVGQSAYEPQITSTANGAAIAVWRRLNGTNFIIQSATRPPGGSFGAPVDLSAVGQNAYQAQISAAPDGTATAVWYRFDGSNYIIQAATRPSGGSFGSPVDLSTPGEDAFSPQIALAPDGTATAVWRRSNGTNQITQAATRPAGGTFDEPINLSVTGQDAYNPGITIAPDGSASTVWYRSNGTDDIVQSISTTQPSLLLGVATGGSGSGTVTSTPPGIDCGSDCAENYPSFTKVTLTASPKAGSAFEGWGGACQAETGNTCKLTMLEDRNAVANFERSPPTGKAKLRITRVKPRKAQVKRGRKIKLRITSKNVGDATAINARLCLKLNQSLKKRLKPKGKLCRKLGSLGIGKAKTRAFKLKATGKAKRGKKYKVKFRLSAKGAKTAIRALKIRVR